MQYFINRHEIGNNPADIRLQELTEQERECFEERAAIMEYDGGMERDVAEKMAWQRIMEGRVSLAG